MTTTAIVAGDAAPGSAETPTPAFSRPCDEWSGTKSSAHPKSRRRRTPVCLLLLAVYLLCPKVPIRGASGYSAEIRIEDLVTIVAALWLVATGRLHRTPVPKPVGAYLVFIWINLFSALVNQGRIGVEGLIFTARLTEYLVWFAVGWAIANEATKETVLRVACVVAGVLICWAALELVGAIPQVGRFVGTKGRISLNTNGPYEAATVVLLLALVVRSKALRIGLAVVVLLTQARVTLAAGLVAGFAYARTRHVLHRFVPALFAIGGLSIGLLAMFPSNRLKETPSPVQMVETLASTWHRVPVVSTYTEYVSETEFGENLFNYIPGKIDLSFEVRAVRWTTVLKSTCSDVAGFVLGRGPSAWGIGVDGYYVRLVGEVGLAGLAGFAAFILVTLRRYARDSVTHNAVISLLVTAVFIDIFVSSKAMPLLWAIIAWDELQLRRRPVSEVHEPAPLVLRIPGQR